MWWNNYLDIRFKEKGRTAMGCDCWGLVRLIYQEQCSIPLPSYDDDYIATNNHEILSVLIDSESRKWNQVEKPHEFDVVVLRLKGVPFHVGVVTRGGFMLHCSQGINTSHERLDSMRWKNRIIGYYRHESIGK